MIGALGLDVGGTNTKLVLVDHHGAVLARDRRATVTTSAAALAAGLIESLTAVERQHGPVELVGVAAPGLVRRESDVVHWMQGRMQVVQGLDWTAALQRRAPVSLLNDAQAALLGEAWLGAGRGCRDLVMLTLGTGVGGAVLSDGRLLTGSTGRAGHLGHMALRVPGDKDIVNTPGSLEDAVGDCTVATRSGGRFTSTQALVAACLTGDREARLVWDASVQMLAAALASIVNAFDPERIILGGGIAAHAWDALLPPLRHWMDEYEWRPAGTATPIVAAALGDEAGAIGAARHAMVRAAR